jgi:hypothetical protein
MNPKNCFLVVFLLAGLPLMLHAQMKFGIQGGLNTTQIDPGKLVILDQDDREDFELAVNRARYGYHLGVFFQAQADFLFIQPAIWFRSSSVDYTINDVQDSSLSNVLTERYQYLDIPILLGLKLGPLRIGCGPVGHIYINSTSELFDTDPVDGYEQQFEDMTVGYIAGLGLDIWNFHLDLNYEGSFNRFGDHFTFFGEEYAFDNSPSRLIATIGISF